MTTLDLKLSTIAKPYNRDQVPSTATEQMLADALASDNIDTVKAHVAHIWAHYQSLEFFLTNTAVNLKALRSALEEPRVENDLDPVEFLVNYYAGPAVLLAYEAAHDLDVYVHLMGMNVPDALRTYYDEAVDTNIGTVIDAMEAEAADPARFAAGVSIQDLLDEALNDMGLDEDKGEDG